jgi:hypothetical protein
MAGHSLIPLLDAEDRGRWRRNPAAYTITEWLHEAQEELAAALEDRVNETAMRLYRDPSMPARSPERLAEACERLARAQREWRAVLASAEALLRDQEGGE